MYFRFVTREIDRVSRQPRGVFQSAYDLADDGEMPEWDRDALWEDLFWFADHLPIPPAERFARGRGISWYRDDAREFIHRMWSMVAVLREHGVVVRHLRTGNPGWIAYEDRLQIVAVPWRDTGRRIRPLQREARSL